MKKSINCSVLNISSLFMIMMMNDCCGRCPTETRGDDTWRTRWSNNNRRLLHNIWRLLDYTWRGLYNTSWGCINYFWFRCDYNWEKFSLCKFVRLLCHSTVKGRSFISCECEEIQKFHLYLYSTKTIYIEFPGKLLRKYLFLVTIF